MYTERYNESFFMRQQERRQNKPMISYPYRYGLRRRQYKADRLERGMQSRGDMGTAPPSRTSLAGLGQRKASRLIIRQQRLEHKLELSCWRICLMMPRLSNPVRPRGAVVGVCALAF